MTSKVRTIASTFSLLLLFSSWTTTVYSLPGDGATLLSIASEWKAGLWDNASSNTDPCNDPWEGVTCDSSGHVIALNLSNKGLTGPVPSDISKLVSLVSLDLCSAADIQTPSRNSISGDLSPIGSLTNLKSLNVSFNILDAQFPDAVLQLTNLVTLKLMSARITGPFPRGLDKLVNLQYLYLGNNSMTGDLPPELGKLINLVNFTLWNNTFSSKIPRELSNLVNLTYLNLHLCDLWGGLPPEFGNLRSMKTLHLYRNQLSGPIPKTWQNMTDLEDLELYENFLSKDFPTWILSHPNLQKVDLSKNYFYGDVPNLDGYLNSTHLPYVKISCNFFSGNETSIRYPLNVPLLANCFSYHNSSDGVREMCNQYYESCDEFSKVANGACPNCPPYQNLENSIYCICGKDTGRSQSSKAFKVIVPIMSVALFLLVAYMAYSKWKSYVKKQGIDFFGRKISSKELHECKEDFKEVRRFTFEELAKGTGNFDEDHEMGVGGFEKVFLGVLDNGNKVVIKRASTSSMHNSFEFQSEVLLLSRFHHQNLVRFEGFCEEKELQVLVYEYMPNGSLHTRLFLCDDRQTLDWYSRLEIAIGIAHGINYLHSFMDQPMVYRDVKSSNILLDENLVAKLANFGITKAITKFDNHISTMPTGTTGYIDPQYFLRRRFTTASDVYGFGVVLLELVTGQKAIDHTRLDEPSLVEWVRLKLKPEGVETIVDPRLHKSYPRKVYYDVVQLAIDCASFNETDRPSMKAVVHVLQSCLWAAGPPPS